MHNVCLHTINCSIELTSQTNFQWTIIGFGSSSKRTSIHTFRCGCLCCCFTTLCETNAERNQCKIINFLRHFHFFFFFCVKWNSIVYQSTQSMNIEFIKWINFLNNNEHNDIVYSTCLLLNSKIFVSRIISIYIFVTAK